MKWCVSFPEEEILIVRPSLNAICAGNRAAAKLLSVLLYRYSIRKESREDAENINEVEASKGKEPTQDTSFRIYRKQEQLVKDMCGEIVEKTLHDVAVPTLQLLGYLDIDESSPIICYELHPDVITNAMEAYKKGSKQLEKFLINTLQLEKFLISDQLEEVLINKKNFQLALEKVLIANRKISNNKRGRKPASEKGADSKNQKPQINRENIEINNRENSNVATAHADVASISHTLSLSEKNDAKEQPVTPPTKKEPAPPAPAKPAKGTRAPSSLSKEGQHIQELWQTCTNRKLSLTPANIKALNGLGDVVASDDDFNEAFKMMKENKFYKDNGVRIDIDFMFRKYDGWIDKVYEARNQAKLVAKSAQAAPQPNAPRQLTDLEKKNREMAARFMKKAN